MIDASPDKPSADLKTVRQFVRFADRLGIRFLGVSGGEPLEHPQFFHVLDLLLQKKTRMVVVMTNGRWLENETLTAKLIALQKKRPFGLQITAIPELYPHAVGTTAAYERHKHRFDPTMTQLIDKLTVMTDIGRAKGKDWSHLGELYQRQVPNCFNLIFNAKRFPSLRDMIEALETQSTSNFCKPAVGPHGNVHVGENPHCSVIGTIWDSEERLYKNLQQTGFCGACGDPIPPHRLN
jgi:hypothetical protein